MRAVLWESQSAAPPSLRGLLGPVPSHMSTSALGMAFVSDAGDPSSSRPLGDDLGEETAPRSEEIAENRKGREETATTLTQAIADLRLSEDDAEIGSYLSGAQDMLQKYLSNKPRILKCVPKSSRRQFRDILSKTLADVNNPSNEELWTKLFTLPSHCLLQPDRGGTGRRKSLAHIVNKQIDGFSKLREFTIQTAKKQKKPNKASVSVKLARAVCSKIDEGDIRGSVPLLTSDCGIAHNDDTTLEIFTRKATT